VAVGQIPTAYALLGAETGYKPLAPEQLRMAVYGPRYGGKSTFLAGRPRTLIIDTEIGAWGIPDKFTKAVRISTKDPVLIEKVIAQLERDGKMATRPFDHVVFDTIDQLAELWAKKLAQDYSGDKWSGTDIRNWGQKGAGYSILTSSVWDLIQRVEKAGYGWSVVGHLKEKDIEINNKEITVVRPALFDMFTSLVTRNADVVTVIEPTVVFEDVFATITGGKKVKTGTRETKRIQFNAKVQEIGLGTGTGKLRGVANLDMSFLLPDFAEGNTGWDKFVTEYNAAVEKVRQGLFN